MPSPDSPKSPVLCVDIGGTSTKAGVLNTSGEMQFLNSIPTKPDVESYVRNLVALIEQTIETAKSQHQGMRQMGVAVAGFLDSARDHLVYNSNLPWLEGFPLRNTLAERFPAFAIELEVDSNAATMAEYRFGTAQNSRRFLCLTSGTGLGVGMTVDGVPLRFAYGCMGDIGHVIVLRDGPLCTCGGRGCAEIMVSAPVVAERYRTNAGIESEQSLRDVIEAAEAGNPAAIAVLREAGEWLGIAVASMANMLFPDH
ncbi:MAG TPA: ROK family protein, partial [Bryobacteraceae bacterium]|nr:ROK family protein [Bryobacteraceae bacterium]